MTTVLLHSWRGMKPANIADAGVINADLAASLLVQPYLSGQKVLLEPGVPFVSEEALAPASTSLLTIQAGVLLHYEVTPQGQPIRQATDASPVLRDYRVLFGSRWRISLLLPAKPGVEVIS